MEAEDQVNCRETETGVPAHGAGPSTHRILGARKFRRTLNPRGFVPSVPATAVISIFAVVIMLLSSVGNVHANPPPGGLPGGILGSASPYYPFLISPSMYPVPDVAVPQSSLLNVSLPQLAATGIGTNPTYFLVYDLAGMQYVGQYPHGQWKFESELLVREGTFSAWLASDFLTGSSTRTLPINWSAPWNIVTENGNCTGTALVSSPDGSAIAAGITCAGTSTIYETSEAKVLTSWPAIGTLTGNQVRLAIDPDGFVLATTITTAGHADATLIPFPSGTENTKDLGPAVQASPVIIRAVQGAVMGVAISQSDGWVSFQTSYTDPWGFGESEGVALYNESNTSTIFGSVGDTGLGTPGGKANQLQAAVVGQSVVVLSTVLIAGKMEAALSTSPDLGVHWASPMLYPLTTGALIDPELVGTQSGYVYATWEGSGGGNLSTIDQTIFSADGRALTTPAPITGGTGPWNTSNVQVVGLAVDSFERPLYVWATAHNKTTSNELVETGGYLPPSQIQALEDQAVWNLTTNDFNGTGSISTYAKGISNLVSEVVANASRASTPRYFNAARNLTADVYQNESTTSFAYFGEQVSGSGNNKKYSISGGAVLTPAVKTGPGYSPPDPYGVIVPSVGFGSAGTYLGIETDWLFASEGVDPTASANPVGNISLPDSDADQLPGWDQPGYASTTVDGNLSSAVLTPTLLNPTTAEFAIAGSFPTYNYTSSSGTTSCNGHNYPTLTYFYEDKPTTFNDTPYVNSITSALPLLTSSTFLSTFYLQNLSADTLINWQVVLNSAYTENETWTGRSGCTVTPHQVNLHYNVVEGPSNINMLAAAEFSTTLSTALSVTEIGRTEVSLHWKNTMIADGESSLSPGIGTTPLTGHVIQAWGNYTGLSLQSGTDYSANVNTSSYPGGWNASWRPSDSDAEQTSSPIQTADSVCQFVYVTNTISVHGLRVVSGSNNTAMVTWWANGNGFGVLEYSELGTALNQTITATISEHGNGTAQYFAVAHGLPGGAFYNLEATTTVADGPCLSLADAESTTAFLGQGFTLNPVGNAFDSITQSGGGEEIYSYLSSGLLTQMSNGVVAFNNGTLVYGPSNLSGPNVTIQIPSLTNIACPGDCYLENLTPRTPNATYVVQEILNFTWNHTLYSIHSSPISFAYLLDSSGDGLTNAEKVDGWTVTYTAIGGTTHNEIVTASPSLYSTNGLVGDFVEKEYGLNPNRVDTAGSAMLDTWNLTFSLQGAGAGQLGAPLHIWTETNGSSTYNPFGTGVQYSPGLFESGHPSAYNVSSVSPTPSGGITSGDGSPNASTELFSYAAFQKFVSLPDVWNDVVVNPSNPGYWLRAVRGAWDGVPTITVWGKLSWGADPLLASTIGGPYPDGDRLDPVATVDLEIRGLDLYVKGLPSGDGYAAQLNLTPGNSGTTKTELVNYTAPVGGQGDLSRLVNYVAALPINQTWQNQTLTLQVLANESNTSTLTAIPYTAGGSSLLYIHYDVFAGKTTSYSFSASNSQYNPNGSINFTLQPVIVGAKATTWLWLPFSNSTVNGLPLGLERYVGEQSFDLVVVNASSTITTNPIPLPWGGIAYLTLHAGLNNILIPRSQFLASPFGNGVLAGSKLAYPTANPNAPILGDSNSSAATAESSISGFGGSQANELEAYWQNRAIESSPGNFSSSETGTPNTSALQLRIAVSTSPSSSNVGGLPSNPSILNSSNANAPTAALQAIATLNVSSTAGLDLLISALLTNTTAGVNGTFQAVTNQVPFLGLDISVLSGLANGSVSSQGIYGVPTWKAPPPTPPSGWGAFFNNPIGSFVNAAGHIVSLVERTMNVVLSSQIFQDALFAFCPLLGAVVLLEKAGVFAVVQALLEAAYAAMMTWLHNALEALFTPAVSPVTSATNRAGGSVDLSMATAGYDATHSEPTQAGEQGGGISTALTNLLIMTLFFAGVALTAVDLASLLSGGVSAIIVGVIIGLILSIAIQAIDMFDNGLVSSFGETVVWDIDGLSNATGTNHWATSWSPGSAAQQASQPIWDGLADIASTPLATTGFVFSVLATLVGLSTGSPVVAAISFALSILALALTCYAQNNPSGGQGDFIGSEFLDVLSLIGDAYSLKGGLSKLDTGGKILTAMSVTLDTATFYADCF